MHYSLKLSEFNPQEQRLTLLKKDFLRHMLHYNLAAQQQQIHSRNNDHKQTQRRYSSINQAALISLDREMQAARVSKLQEQRQLQRDYDRQIYEKQQRIEKERERDRRYAQSLVRCSDTQNQRRYAELISVYNRSNRGVEARRLKTQNIQARSPTPFKQYPEPYLPPIQKEQVRIGSSILERREVWRGGDQRMIDQF